MLEEARVGDGVVYEGDMIGRGGVHGESGGGGVVVTLLGASIRSSVETTVGS